MSDAKPDLAEIIAGALLTQAMRGCLDRRCGAEGRALMGSRHRPVRCADCPLDVFDGVADASERKADA